MTGFGAPLSWLMWDRVAIADGQWWRLLTAHIVHLSTWHWMLNMLGLVWIFKLFCVELTAKEQLSLLLVSALGVSEMLLILQPQLLWYAGISGVLHGLWSGGAMLTWMRTGKPVYLFALLLLAVRLIVFNQGMTDTPVIVAAHLYGAISGLLWLGLWHVQQRFVKFD